MYNIYFDNRKIAICSPEEEYKESLNSITYFSANNENLENLPHILENSNFISEIIIKSKVKESTYKNFCSIYKEINAAGGVVENNNGEILMIFRNGKWDLPKGKQENDEDISITAIREVEEECGIKPQHNGSRICITDHTYELNGEKIIKHTHWYKMSSLNSETVPQIEENITEVKWIRKERIHDYLINTYPSIKEVILKADII